MASARRPGHLGRSKASLPGSSSAALIVQRIEALINGSWKTQRQLAAELGYDKPNIITMFKQGSTRLPAGKVALLAAATGGDPVELMRLWLEEYEPDLLAAIEQYQSLLLTMREREWIAGLRQRFPDGAPPWSAVAASPDSPAGNGA